MSDNPSQNFAEALQRLEAGGDVDRFVEGVFAPDPELLRPETGQRETGAGGAHAFWSQYLAQFADISSQFTRVVEGAVGVLEWTSNGHLASGAEVTYAGVSVLDFDGDGLVTRFATYYDTAAFGT